MSVHDKDVRLSFMGVGEPETLRGRVYDARGPLSPMCDRCEFHADPCASPCATLVSLGWKRRGDDPGSEAQP